MKNIKFLSCAGVALFSCIFCGCISVAGTPNSRFYMPDPVDSGKTLETLDSASEMIVMIGTIKIPRHLDRPQIVTRNKDGTVSFAQFDRWAEPLDASFTRLIRDDLASLLPAANFQGFPCNFAIPLDYQVVVDVVQLDIELQKDMALVAQWSIIDSKSRKMVMTRRSQFSEPVDPHNYFGASKALSGVCASLSKEIGENLLSISKLPKN